MQITANHFLPLTFTEKYFSKVFGLCEAERSFKSKIKTDKLRALSIFDLCKVPSPVQVKLLFVVR